MVESSLSRVFRVLESVTNLGDILPSAARSKLAFLDLGAAPDQRQWTGEAFDRACNQIGGGLQAIGLRRGDHIGIMSANRAEFMIAYFAIMRAGLVAVPLNYRLPAETTNKLAAFAQMRLCFCDDGHLVEAQQFCEAISFDSRSWEEFGAGTCVEVVSPGPGEIAKMLFTSGSTGLPKGVPLTHEGLLWALRQFTPGIAPAEDKTLNVAPFYHKNGLFLSTVALASGSTVVMLPRFEARSYIEAVHRHRVTALSGVPTMFALIAQETGLLEQLDLSCVNSVLMGSAPLSDALMADVQKIFPNATVSNGYGITEAGPAIFGAHPKDAEKPTMSVGYPLPDIEWRLDGVDDRQGTLYLKTPAMTPGYFNRPEISKEKFEDGWYNTGDIMRRDAAGFFYFVGRADDMFVCGGENIYPGEIEEILESHAAVSQAVVVSAPDDIKGGVPAAFVVRSPRTTVSAEELKQFALQRGPAYQHPRYIEFVESVPLASTNKIDYRTLRKRSAKLAKDAGRSTKH